MRQRYQPKNHAEILDRMEKQEFIPWTRQEGIEFLAGVVRTKDGGRSLLQNQMKAVELLEKLTAGTAAAMESPEEKPDVYVAEWLRKTQ